MAASAAAPANGDSSVNGSDLPPAIGCSLLILYGSETGTAQVRKRRRRGVWNERVKQSAPLPLHAAATEPLLARPSFPPTTTTNNNNKQQEAAERVAREARARHWSPRVLPADAADLRQLPREHAAVFLVATAGQGEFPANCRGLWRFLARASLPRGCLSALRVAVFGFGDSGYPLFNAAARKLRRRLVEGLGAEALAPLGLGDDQDEAGGGPDAALDTWLRELWPALRATTAPLPAGVPEETLGGDGGDGDEVSRLGPCRFSVEVVARGAAVGEKSDSSSSSASSFLPSREEALAAHAAFHRLDALASGELEAPPGYEEEERGEGSGSGPARPLFAVAAANRRLSPPSHWQETRHLSLRITRGASSPPKKSEKKEEEKPRHHFFYGPGDVAAFLPEQSGESVRRVLAASGRGPRDRVRVSAAVSAVAAGAAGATAPASFETTAAALVAGVLELDGAPPRRRLFEVLAAFVSEDAAADAAAGGEEKGGVPASLSKERLRLFASPEGRADLALYCSGESRTLSEVLSDFPQAARAAPLAWLLAAAPRLRPRRFSIASAPGGEEKEEAGLLDLTVAVVRYHTPHGRPRLGLASGWLSTLGREEEEEGEGTKSSEGLAVPLWIERGALSLHPALAAAAARQLRAKNQQQQPPPLALTPLEAWLSTPLILVGPGTGIAPMRSLLQARRRAMQAAAARTKKSGASTGDSTAAAAVAPCWLYFGCRSPSADWYYRPEFEAMVADGTLRGYRAAFSREEEEEEGEMEGEEQGEDGQKRKKAKKLKPKRYVTHLLREDAGELWRLLSPPLSSNLPPATVVVAGSAKNMPRDVQQCFETIAAEQGGLGDEGGKAFVRRMVTSGRYFVEAWS